MPNKLSIGCLLHFRGHGFRGQDTCVADRKSDREIREQIAAATHFDAEGERPRSPNGAVLKLDAGGPNARIERGLQR